MNKIVILTALREELAAVVAGLPKGAQQFEVIRGGIGPDSAARSAGELFKTGTPQLLCSTGFCGGIADGLAVGDIVLATAIVEGDAQRRPRIDLAPELFKRLSDALKSAGITFHSGVIVSVR